MHTGFAPDVNVVVVVAVVFAKIVVGRGVSSGGGLGHAAVVTAVFFFKASFTSRYPECTHASDRQAVRLRLLRSRSLM